MFRTRGRLVFYVALPYALSHIPIFVWFPVDVDFCPRNGQWVDRSPMEGPRLPGATGGMECASIIFFIVRKPFLNHGLIFVWLPVDVTFVHALTGCGQVCKGGGVCRGPLFWIAFPVPGEDFRQRKAPSG